jgi:acyl carrier protein
MLLFAYSKNLVQHHLLGNLMPPCTTQDIISIILDLDSIQLQTDQEISNTLTLDKLGIDSLDKMSIFIMIEEKYEINIPDEDFVTLNTLEQIKDYINQSLSSS